MSGAASALRSPAVRLGWAFAAAIFVSAFLLFQVQPLISKAILPWFGGSPAVWTTAVLFFQTVLFGGYLYAHLLQRFLPARRQAVVHLAVIVGAAATLPILPGASWKPLDSADPTWRVLLLLAVTVGLPYFALSATSPLVQAWFSRAYPGRSPYRLYALSNVGSLAGLLTYPLFFERAMDLGGQSAFWTADFVLYGCLCAVAAAALHKARGAEAAVDDPPGEPVASAAGATAERPQRVTWPRRVAWVALPAWASLMLLATTNQACQNMTPVPFLWVVPLTLYLLSFIICFDHQRWYIRGFWAAAAGVLLIATAGNEAFNWFGYRLSIPQELSLYFATLLAVCMVCHGELVRLKPHPRHLTEFYLLIAAGGALGGTLVNIVAPHVFKTYFEWSIGLVGSYLVACVALILAGPAGRRRQVWTLALFAPMAVGAWYLVNWQRPGPAPLYRARNFYGVISVREYDEGKPTHCFTLRHNAITHGRQFADPARRRWPTCYYHEDSGVGRALDYAGRRGPLRVGAVGLGVGTLAAYGRPGDVYRFYEIDPNVIHAAGTYFTFLGECRGQCETILGDARLSLEREAPQNYDVLVLDAFSGDAIPAHLITREAFEIYLRHLAPRGIIAVHVTNRYLYLAPVVKKLAGHFGLKIVRIDTGVEEARLRLHCDWMLLTADEQLLEAVPSRLPKEADDFDVPLWTDQYNNLMQLLRSRG